ncbi:MAG: site-2 protease family protein [Thermoplasmata archaeon]
MRGPYSEYAAPPIYVYPSGPKPGVHFSRKELVQLGIAILALSAAFTILYIRSNPVVFFANPAIFLAYYFPASLLAVGTGVGLHEVMHKVVAQRYGLWAEFRYNPQGLLFAFVLAALVGFLYGAPGATWISGAVTREQNGRISAAGPLTNVVIAAVLVAVFLVLLSRASSFGGILLVIYLLPAAASVNAFLAAFNLLPIMPLDGAKVWAWNKPAYLAIVVTAIVLVGLSLSLPFF